MAQIIVRQLPDEIHRALKARAILAQAVLPDTRPKVGDLMCSFWQGADVPELFIERDKTPHEPLGFE
jgi:plasmid stability protein